MNDDIFDILGISIFLSDSESDPLEDIFPTSFSSDDNATDGPDSDKTDEKRLM